MREMLSQIRRIEMTGGGLVLGPRPGKKSKSAMAAMGLSHVCTLLSAREGPASVERIASELNCAWVWLPMSGGGVSTLQELDAMSIVSKLAGALKDARRPRVYLHCSAGIHRTGFFASLLLRLKPMDAGDILRSLAALRPVTAEQVGHDRIALAVAKADALLKLE